MNAIDAAFIAACRDEIEAPKPGNVHVFAAGHDMTADEFLRSAEAAAHPLCKPEAPIGLRILGAVDATFARVAKNTNLGIILLCAPLAAAAGRAGDLRANLQSALAALTCADATYAFKAILRANPAGLGTASRHDVHEPARVTLLEAMREAAPRDKIAYQYSYDFEDVFSTGLAALHAARAKCWQSPWPQTSAYLAFLARFLDSHIVRKNGKEAAEFAQREAAALRARFMAAANPAECLEGLLDFDKCLKSLGLNPGTSADLTVASLFAERLTHGLINRSNNG